MARKLLLIILVLFFGITSVQATQVHFAQISDIHYQPKAPENEKSAKLKFYALKILDDAISQINDDKKIDFVLVTGDAADKPIKEDFEFIYNYLNKNLKYKWYYTLGNHDSSVKANFAKKEQLELLNKINPKGFDKEKTYYSFKPKRDITFIALDATYDKWVSPGYLPPEQLKFLDSELQKAKNNTVVIFLHHPTVYPIAHTNHEIVNDFAIYEILKKYKNPILVLGGHYHGTKIKQDGNIIHVASPALVSYPCAFRIITINNKKDETIFTFEYRETNLKDLQKKAKIKAVGSKIKWLYGGESDRNNVITIDKKAQIK